MTLFNFYSAPDLHNADMVIAYVDQGGLTLPDRDYYIKDDPKQVEMRKTLTDYITQVFTLGGNRRSRLRSRAKTVLRIETALAKAEMDRTQRRDPKNRDHKMQADEAVALAPNFYLMRYFTDVDAPAFSEMNVANPEFFKQVNEVIESESLDALKTYASWHLLHSAAPWLSKPFVDANFKLTAVAHWPNRDPGTLEALRGCDRRRAGRGAGAEVRRCDIRRGRQSAHAKDGGRAGGVAGPGYPRAARGCRTKPRNRRR